MIGRVGLGLLVGLCVAGAAEARSHRLPGFHAPRTPKAHVSRSRHGSGMAEIKPLGPSSFHPVKRYKGFSYLEHETHPEKDD